MYRILKPKEISQYYGESVVSNILNKLRKESKESYLAFKERGLPVHIIEKYINEMEK